MAVNKCKGTLLKQDLASTYTTVAQVISMGIDGSASEVFKSSTLDQAGAYHTYAQTGYVEPGKATAEIFYDPGLSGHQSVTDVQATPADENWRFVYADTGLSEQSFVGASLEFGVAVSMDDGLKATIGIQIDGDVGWKT